jgi:isopenicillin N synthase-like dioxygenase
MMALRNACDAPGWFTLDAECAISSELVQECYARMRDFFALPLPVKQNYMHTQYERETGG